MTRCPRCTTALEEQSDKTRILYFCGKCKGAAIPFRLLTEKVQSAHVVKIVDAARANPVRGKVLCPGCRKSMTPVNQMSRVGMYEVDVCLDCEHVWFDPGELADAPRTPDMRKSLDRVRQFDADLQNAFNRHYSHGILGRHRYCDEIAMLEVLDLLFNYGDD